MSRTTTMSATPEVGTMHCPATGQLVDLDRKHYALALLYDELDDASLKGDQVHWHRCNNEMTCLYHQRSELRRAVLTTAAATFADATVQAMHAFAVVESYNHNDLDHAVKTGNMAKSVSELRKALASIVSVLAPIAGLRIDQIAYPDLSQRVARALTETEEEEGPGSRTARSRTRWPSCGRVTPRTSG